MEKQSFITDSDVISPSFLSNDLLLEGGGLLSSDCLVSVIFIGWLLYTWAAQISWRDWDKKLLLFLRQKHILSFSHQAERHKSYRYMNF